MPLRRPPGRESHVADIFHQHAQRGFVRVDRAVYPGSVPMTIGHVVYGRGPVHAVVIHGWFYDCRGYGASREMGGPFDMDTVAADALSLASHLQWERFSLVGHSMGGKAALR